MPRPHPVRGEDFGQFDDAAALAEFAPSVRLVGRERDTPGDVVDARYQYYAAGPRAAHEAFVESARGIVDVVAKDCDSWQFRERAHRYTWDIEIFTPVNSVPYLYDLAYRTAELDERLSTVKVLLLWSKHDRVATCDDRLRYYTTPCEAISLAVKGYRECDCDGIPPITELVPEYERSDPTVSNDAIPPLGCHEYRFDMEVPPHHEPDGREYEDAPL